MIGGLLNFAWALVLFAAFAITGDPNWLWGLAISIPAAFFCLALEAMS